MSKRDVLLPIHNFSDLKSLANNAKIRSSLKILLIWYRSNESARRQMCQISNLFQRNITYDNITLHHNNHTFRKMQK